MEQNKLIYFGLILGVCLIASSALASLAFYNAKSQDNTFQSTGSAKKKISSDTVKLVTSFNRKVAETDLNSGYSQMKNDLKIVTEFFKNNGIDEKNLITSAVVMEQQYNNYNPSGPREYVLRQTVEIDSGDIAKITDLSKKAQEVAEKGVIFSVQSLEYYYSKLPDLRIELLGEAVKDAKLRAEKIAESSGKKIGNIKSASLGVTQVLPVNSIDISDYGTYDTSSIEKEVMVTVKANFIIK